jgi:hypothetical protein
LTPKAGQTRDELKRTQSNAYAKGEINLGAGASILDVASFDSDNLEPIVIV